VDACKIGVTIAVRYSASRPQFGDRPILAYITQQRRLFGGLATTYAMHLAMLALKQIAVQVGGRAAAAAEETCCSTARLPFTAAFRRSTGGCYQRRAWDPAPRRRLIAWLAAGELSRPKPELKLRATPATVCCLFQGGPEAGKRVHVVSSGLKAAATWHRKTVLNHCRECCGGMGFMAANRIGPMLNDMDGGWVHGWWWWWCVWVCDGGGGGHGWWRPSLCGLGRWEHQRNPAAAP
jgi:alkylation response protein AidB-like acyl-CoA dehydrogenase